VSRPCSVCVAFDRDLIDLELSGGASFGAIGRKHEVTPYALRRHKQNHLTPALVKLAQQRRAEGSAISVAERLEEVVLRAGRLLDRAERKGSLVAASQILAQLRMTLETLAKLSGELNDRPQVNVLNVVSSPDWQVLRATILAALGPYPEARQAVAVALMASQPAELGVGV
jgi:hypothetical protein